MSTISQNGVVSGRNTFHSGIITIVPPKQGVTIGNFCAIGPNLIIMGTNHDYNYPAVQYTFYNKYLDQQHPGILNSTNIHSKGSINIGNDVWFGNDVVVMAGVNIGDGCCIGARSVVTKDLDPYTICVGTPCKSIKTRYTDKVIQFLLDLKWWDWDDEQFKNNKIFFNSNLNEMNLDSIKELIKL
uniref:Transferase hexapeptide six repeats protein n=1 Tax=Pithovirus LCPAC101 TaxID=2506586 RepID=A0A481Z4S4_9VIRU|nr:MAG: transferase hexapeptide six repeats protein [Pithovirus LCPAC101]